MDSCQSERCGATSFIAAGSPAKGNTRISGGAVPATSDPTFKLPIIGASIKCRCSAII